MNVGPWIILFSPLVAAFVIALITERAKKLSSYISVAAIAISFVFSLGVFVGPDGSASLTWIDLGSFQVKIGYLINDLTKLMLLVVTGVGLLIHIYSVGYMAHDKGRSRYFAGLSLFTFSMLGIVLANNFIMMFIFWELVGFCSYLLIGHWFDRPAPPDAANKAFLANRIGDFGFMLGILMVWLGSGTVSFDELGQHWQALNLNPVFMTAAALLMFCGAIGKSAQFPLHVWLPDAMEGPTPVSALIHAATMVAAGVYMLARTFFLFQNTPAALTVILWIGDHHATGGADGNSAERHQAHSRILDPLATRTDDCGGRSWRSAGWRCSTFLRMRFSRRCCSSAQGSVIHSLHDEQRHLAEWAASEAKCRSRSGHSRRHTRLD